MASTSQLVRNSIAKNVGNKIPPLALVTSSKFAQRIKDNVLAEKARAFVLSVTRIAAVGVAQKLRPGVKSLYMKAHELEKVLIPERVKRRRRQREAAVRIVWAVKRYLARRRANMLHNYMSHMLSVAFKVVFLQRWHRKWLSNRRIKAQLWSCGRIQRAFRRVSGIYTAVFNVIWSKTDQFFCLTAIRLVYPEKESGSSHPAVLA